MIKIATKRIISGCKHKKTKMKIAKIMTKKIANNCNQ